MKECEKYNQDLFLGRGSFGSVYRVREICTGRIYACKVAEGKGVEYLRKEAGLLRELHHPLFPHYKEEWENEYKSFLCMEYVPGCTLEELVQRRGRLTVKTVRFIAGELADGLALLHREGYVFRDIKPANIMIRQDGKVKLLDFGCVCPVGEECNILAGSPGFAAPEQFVKGNPQKCMDVYAMGKVMQYMLLGRKEKRDWKHCRCSARMRKIVNYCLQQNEENRPPNMEVVLKMLRGGKIKSNYKIIQDVWKQGGRG